MTDDDLVKCAACNGRGYHCCACWPGDCICGEDYRDCEDCGGTGWTWPDQDEPCRASCEGDCIFDKPEL